jgi:hypothetical protein
MTAKEVLDADKKIKGGAEGGSSSPKKMGRRAKAMGSKEEKNDEDSINENVGDDVLPQKKKEITAAEIQALIPKVGERLLTGQVVKPSIPRAISGPAAQSDEYLALERERNANKKEIEEQEKERQRVMRAAGDIS